MIIVMKPGTPRTEIEKVRATMEKDGFQIDESKGVNVTLMGIIGDTSAIDPRQIMVNQWVEKVMRVQEPFKRASRTFHPEDTIVDVGGIKIGGN